MISIFDEISYANNILNNGFITNKKGLELFILAKYYRFECGKTKSECKNLLIDFCKRNVENYSNGDFYRKVNSAITQAYKKDVQLLNIKHIEFNDLELDYINKLHISPNAKKVLFGLWCCNKLNIKAGQSDRWVFTTPTDLKKFCNLQSNIKILQIINELYSNGLIFISDKWAISLSFLDNIDCNDYNMEFKIVDFDTCGLWWEKYLGNKKVRHCCRCDKLFVKNSNRQSYCKECAKEKELEKYKKYNAKR